MGAAAAPPVARPGTALRLGVDRHPGRAQRAAGDGGAGLRLALSPVTPEILAARELRRGTLQLIEDIAPYRHLGIEPPPLHLLINRVHPVSSNARLIQQALRDLFQASRRAACWTPTCRPSKPIPALRPGPAGASGRVPAAAGRVAPAALETMRALAGELFPQWQERFALVSGRPDAPEGAPMANAHELARGHKRLRALIEFALGEGWHVKRTPAGTSNSPSRLRVDLHQLDRERPPGRPQCPRADPPPREARWPRRQRGCRPWLR
jgi:chromosome partitioning related protein ParA